MDGEVRPLPPFVSDWDIKDSLRWPSNPRPHCDYNLGRIANGSILFMDHHPFNDRQHDNSFVIPNPCERCRNLNRDCNRAYPACQHCYWDRQTTCTPSFHRRGPRWQPYQFIHLTYNRNSNSTRPTEYGASSSYPVPVRREQNWRSNEQHGGQKRNYDSSMNQYDAFSGKRTRNEYYGRYQSDWGTSRRPSEIPRVLPSKSHNDRWSNEAIPRSGYNQGRFDDQSSSNRDIHTLHSHSNPLDFRQLDNQRSGIYHPTVYPLPQNVHFSPNLPPPSDLRMDQQFGEPPLSGTTSRYPTIGPPRGTYPHASEEAYEEWRGIDAHNESTTMLKPASLPQEGFDMTPHSLQNISKEPVSSMLIGALTANMESMRVNMHEERSSSLAPVEPRRDALAGNSQPFWDTTAADASTTAPSSSSGPPQFAPAVSASRVLADGLPPPLLLKQPRHSSARRPNIPPPLVDHYPQQISRPRKDQKPIKHTPQPVPTVLKQPTATASPDSSMAPALQPPPPPSLSPSPSPPLPPPSTEPASPIPMELTSEPVAEPPLASAPEPALAISTEPTPPILTELPSPTPSSPLTPLPEEISEEEELEVEEDIPKRGRKPTKPKAITTKRKSKKMRKNGSEPDPHVTTLESLKGRIIPLMWSDTWQEICDTAPYFGHFVHGFSYTTIEMEGILIDEEYGITCSKWDNEDVYLKIRPVNTKQSKFETVLKRLQYNQSGSLPLCLAASQEGSGVPFHLPVPYSVFGLFTVEDITPDAETHSSGKRGTCNWSLHLRAFRTDAHRWWKFYAPNSDFVLPDNIKLALSKKPTPSSDPEATLEGLKLQAELFIPVNYYTLVAPGAARLGESTSAREIKVYTSVSESWIITQRKDEKHMSPTEFIENLFCGSRCRGCGKISLRKFWTVFECSCCKTRRVITQMHWHPNLFKHRHTLFDGIRRYGTKEKSTGWFNRRMSAWDDQVRTYTYTLGEGKKRIRIAHVISSGNADILNQVANVLNDVVTIPDFQRPINDVTKELEKYYYYPVGMGEGSLHPSIPMTSFDDTQETGEKVTLPLSDFMLGCAGRTFLVDGVPPWDVQLLSVGNDQTPPYSPPIEDPGRKPFRVALTTLGAHCEVTIQPKDGDKESRLELNMTHGDFVVLETTCSLRLFKVKRYDFGILVLCLWN